MICWRSVWIVWLRANKHKINMSNSLKPMCLSIAAIGEESFKYGLAVLIRSVATSCVATSELRFFILDLNLTSASRRKLAQTISGLGRKATLEFLDPESSLLLQNIITTLTLQKRSFNERCWFAKFAIPDLLSNRLDHVFYLDSDFYCGLDLSVARQLQGAYPVCAVIDGATKACGFNAEFARAILPDAETPYFNAGLMGMDLAYWRDNGLSEQALIIAKKCGAKLIDQDLFNLLYCRKWMELPWEWNYQCPFHYGLFEEIADGRRIINLHYLTNPKPWHVPFQKKTAFFYQVLDQTAYCGWRPNTLYWMMHLKIRTAKYYYHKMATAAISLIRRRFSQK
jgi:lipopolysaccharide biosynthesis glycosyltransferase